MPRSSSWLPRQDIYVFLPSHELYLLCNHFCTEPSILVLKLTDGTAMDIQLPQQTWIFSDLRVDPLERDLVVDWTLDGLRTKVRERYLSEAVAWLNEAEKVGRWFELDRKRLWAVHGKERK